METNNSSSSVNMSILNSDQNPKLQNLEQTHIKNPEELNNNSRSDSDYNVPNIAELRKNAICFVPHSFGSNHVIDPF